MRKLNRQSHKTKVTIEIHGEIFNIKNPYRDDAQILCDSLADQIYVSIRKSETDISDIARNLGFREKNIQKIKEHVFINKHFIDRYKDDGVAIQYKEFDPNLHQALAWKRLESRSREMMKSECEKKGTFFYIITLYNNV